MSTRQGERTPRSRPRPPLALDSGLQDGEQTGVALKPPVWCSGPSRLMPPGGLLLGAGEPGRKLRGTRLVRFVLQEGPWGSGEGLDPCGVQRWGRGKLTVCGQGAGALVRAGARCLGGWARAACPGPWALGVEEDAREAGWVFGAEGEGGLSNEAAVLDPSWGSEGERAGSRGRGAGRTRVAWSCAV